MTAVNDNAWFPASAEKLLLGISYMLRAEVGASASSSQNHKSIWVPLACLVHQTAFVVHANRVKLPHPCSSRPYSYAVHSRVSKHDRGRVRSLSGLRSTSVSQRILA